MVPGPLVAWLVSLCTLQHFSHQLPMESAGKVRGRNGGRAWSNVTPDAPMSCAPQDTNTKHHLPYCEEPPVALSPLLERQGSSPSRLRTVLAAQIQGAILGVPRSVDATNRESAGVLSGSPKSALCLRDQCWCRQYQSQSGCACFPLRQPSLASVETLRDGPKEGVGKGRVFLGGGKAGCGHLGLGHKVESKASFQADPRSL